jgi:hypothetical protein
MPCLADLAQGTVCKILDQEEIKLHKVRYYLEQRDPDFAERMAEVLCVYRMVTCFARDHEYKRHGTVSLLAGIDLVTGQASSTTSLARKARFGMTCS